MLCVYLLIYLFIHLFIYHISVDIGRVARCHGYSLGAGWYKNDTQCLPLRGERDGGEECFFCKARNNSPREYFACNEKVGRPTITEFAVDPRPS